jgi:transcriptional regulator with XRE-family HTH domain
MSLLKIENLTNMKPEKEFCRALAAEIRKEREQARKTQNEVYCETNINIARLEKGDASIELFTFMFICRYFGVNSDEVLKRLETSHTYDLKRSPRSGLIKKSEELSPTSLF